MDKAQLENFDILPSKWWVIMLQQNLYRGFMFKITGQPQNILIMGLRSQHLFEFFVVVSFKHLLQADLCKNDISN